MSKTSRAGAALESTLTKTLPFTAVAKRTQPLRQPQAVHPVYCVAGTTLYSGSAPNDELSKLCIGGTNGITEV